MASLPRGVLNTLKKCLSGSFLTEEVAEVPSRSSGRQHCFQLGDKTWHNVKLSQQTQNYILLA